MANDCNFDMQIVGEKSAVEEFVQMMRWHGPDERHKGFGRIFFVQVYERHEYENFVKYFVDGDCAWSIFSAMMSDGGARVPSLESECKRLNLALEAFSSEPGVGFQEHYIIVNGEVIVEECKDYEEVDLNLYSDEEIEEVITDYCKQCNISRETFDKRIDEDDVYHYGGLGDDYLDYSDLTEHLSK